MLKPHKYMNLELSIVNLSSLIIQELKKDKYLKYDTLYRRIRARTNEEIKDNFLYSLNFLYLMGTIRYVKEKDIVELIE